MLKPLFDAPDLPLWCWEFPVRMPGGVVFPGRAHLLRLDDGGLWMHSPGPVDDRTAAAIDALGPVRHIVAPNRLHHLYVNQAHDRWPEATLHAAPGLPEKRPTVPFSQVLGDDAPDAWRGQLDQLLVPGAPDVNELVFLHRASGTLLVTDLLFNIHEAANWRSWMVFALFARAYGRPAQSRLWRLFTKDRAAAGAAIRRLLTWDIQRVSMAHGDPIAEDARTALSQAWEWMLGAAPALGADAGSAATG